MKLLQLFMLIMFTALSLGACATPVNSQISDPPSTAVATLAPTASFPDCVDRSKVSYAEVIEVLDGDTIVALVNGEKVHIRYIGIDAPEKNFALQLSEQATAANARLLEEGQVTLYADVDDYDDYDRQLRYVFAGDIFVNLQLTALGLADVSEYPPNTACNSTLETAEAAARKAGLGMWKSIPQKPNQGVAGIIEVNKIEEFVIIRNLGSAKLDLNGWILASERGNQTCALHGQLAPGEDLIIHSQKGEGGLSCGLREPIWNNSQRDPASLYDPAGMLIDRWEDD